jgi:hypothetical protein
MNLILSDLEETAHAVSSNQFSAPMVAPARVGGKEGGACT